MGLVHVTDFHDELSSPRIWQHKLCATLSADVNINYRLPTKAYYRICTLRHIRIEIILDSMIYFLIIPRYHNVTLSPLVLPSGLRVTLSYLNYTMYRTMVEFCTLSTDPGSDVYILVYKNIIHSLYPYFITWTSIYYICRHTAFETTP